MCSPIDEFGELPEIKKAAAAKAIRLGHLLLSRWHQTAMPGKLTNYCQLCEHLVIVRVDEDAPAAMYGPAVKEKCAVLSNRYAELEVAR